MLMGCRSTLEYVALPFKSASVNQITLTTVGTMDNLTSIYLGKPKELIKINEKLSSLRCLFKS